jgi:hypothetical protein
VQWFVNDVAGGNSSFGTIVAGLYTAPAQVPNPAAVTVKAVATAERSRLGRSSLHEDEEQSKENDFAGSHGSPGHS